MMTLNVVSYSVLNLVSLFFFSLVLCIQLNAFDSIGNRQVFGLIDKKNGKGDACIEQPSLTFIHCTAFINFFRFVVHFYLACVQSSRVLEVARALIAHTHTHINLKHIIPCAYTGQPTCIKQHRTAIIHIYDVLEQVRTA